MHLTANNQKIGAIQAVDSKYRLLLHPHLTGLSTGGHGFHVHQYPSCAQKGKTAGGYLDP